MLTVLVCIVLVAIELLVIALIVAPRATVGWLRERARRLWSAARSVVPVAPMSPEQPRRR